MILRSVLGGSKNSQEFVGLFLEIRQPGRRYESPIGNQFQPENDFVDFFNDDTHLGDEFSP